MLSNFVCVVLLFPVYGVPAVLDDDKAATPAIKRMEAKLPPLPPDVRAEGQRAIEKALAYLKSKQTKDGGWNDQFGPAVAAIVGQAFAQDPRHGPSHPIVKRAGAYILRFEQSDGGIYEKANNLANYQTSVVLMFLASLKDETHDARVKKAQAMLRRLQYDATESIDLDNPWYGGAGYNTSKRPDLSNTQMMLEALHQSGLSADDPVYKRAVRFVSRCQMLDETNDMPFASDATEGGFIYSPADGGESKASPGLFEGGDRLRSYGSMTYAGFKSLLYADVSRDDVRVRACLDWIRQHYTLDANPGLPKDRSSEGLYYY